MAASVAATSSRLEPVNEGVEGEGLGEGLRAVVTGSRGSSGGSGSGGSSNDGSAQSREVGASHKGGLEGSRGNDRRRAALSGRSSNGSGRRDRGNGGGLLRVGARGRGAGRRARAVQSRAGDLVAGDLGIGVEEDTGIVRLVQGRAEGALGLVGARAGDLDIEALGVVLGAVLRASTVHGDDLVAEDVVAGGKGLGDGGGPGVVVGNEVGGSPRLGADVVAGLVDLDPLEGRLVGGRALAGALGHVGEDGAEVGFGPGGPQEVDLAAGGDGGGDGSGLRVLVAVDVGRLVAGAVDEAVVEVLGVPADGLGHLLAVGLGVVVVELEAALVLAVDADAGDGAVGHDAGGGKGANESSRSLE